MRVDVVTGFLRGDYAVEPLHCRAPRAEAFYVFLDRRHQRIWHAIEAPGHHSTEDLWLIDG